MRKDEKYQNFIFTLLCGASKRFHLFEAPEKKCENKKFIIFQD